MVSTFHYNAKCVSLGGKRFGNHIAEYAGCMYNPENDTMYEAVEVEYKPLLADFGFETLIATLANNMSYWGDYKEVSSQEELSALVESTLEKYGEKIAEYIDADDFDDYIILLLGANEVFKKEKLKKRLLMSFFAS